MATTFDYNAETNQIKRDGAVIGALDATNIVLHEKLAPVLKSNLKKYLTEAGYQVDDFVDPGEQPPVPKGPEDSLPPIPPSPPAPVAVDASPMPAIDPQKGDKTPALVEWYRDNEPAEYQRRYKGRKTHLGRI